jgi:hypothetical protein
MTLMPTTWLKPARRFMLKHMGTGVKPAKEKKAVRPRVLKRSAPGPFTEKLIPALRTMEADAEFKILDLELGGSPFHEEVSVRFELAHPNSSASSVLTYTFASFQPLRENLADFTRFLEQEKLVTEQPGSSTNDLLGTEEGQQAIASLVNAR